MLYLHKKQLEVMDLNSTVNFAYKKAINFRDKYGLGNYCAKELIQILGMVEISERTKVKLIRTPFDNHDLAGFIGYKYDTFIIVTNTNHTLGSERFTIAHELYHLIENRVAIKNKTVIEEMVTNQEKNTDEIMANAFAAELLMPKKDITEQFEHLKVKGVDETDIIMLQHRYGVGYLAITKRLVEIKLIDEKTEERLNELIHIQGALERLTKQLGYSNELNVPSEATFLLQKDLETIRKNYQNGATSYDDLVRIFSYLGCEPESFGYELDHELTEEAKEFMNSLLD